MCCYHIVLVRAISGPSRCSAAFKCESDGFAAVRGMDEVDPVLGSDRKDIARALGKLARGASRAPLEGENSLRRTADSLS
jgi:hypothetical protein